MLNLYKNNLLLIFILFLSSDIFSEIEVRISTDKTEYLEAEPIVCTLTFYNNSENIDSIDVDKLGIYYIKITSKHSDKVQYTGGIGDWIGPAKYVKIKSYGSIDDVFILNHIFVNTILNFWFNSAPGYLAADSYSVQYSFNEKFISKIININILRAEGKELVVFNDLIEANKIISRYRSDIDSLYIKQKKYYDLALNNKESVYWEEAVFRYNEMCNWLKLAYSDIDLNREFIENSPNSFYIKTILINLCQAIYEYEGGEEAVNKNLISLMEKYPNSHVFSEAKHQLKQKDYLNN